MSTTVSIIIPVYNVEKYLDECVESVVSQTYRDIEVILVDDGSSDTSGELCDAWAERDARIRVIHKENGGLSDARNVGIDASVGDYIFFVDSDDSVAPAAIERILFEAERATAEICSCGIENRYEDGRRVTHRVPPLNGDSALFLRNLYRDTRVPVSVWNKLYRREIWDGIRFPVGKLCEDAFTTFKLIDRAKRLVQISDTLYYYRIRSGSIMTSAFRPARMDEEEAWRCNVEFIREKYPRLYRTAYDFYLQKVSVTLATIGEDVRESYSAEYSYLRKILRGNIAYLLTKSRLSPKARLALVLTAVRA